MIDKFHASVADATAQVQSGSSIAIGGFGRAGIPFSLIDAICDHDVSDLHVISNNAGKDEGQGIGRLIGEGRVRKLTCSFPGTAEFARRFFSGRLELELVPQGTLVERLRAGGAGIGAFYTPTSVGTLLCTGEFVTRYDAAGEPAAVGPAKETRRIGEVEHVLEYALHPDVALVKAYRADRYGNLRFRLAARNFNPPCAMAATYTIAEVEEYEPTEVIDPDDVHLPGIFVHAVTPGKPSPIVRVTT